MSHLVMKRENIRSNSKVFKERYLEQLMRGANKMSQEVLSVFGLNYEEMRLLFSLQNYLVESDWYYGKEKDKERKSRWQQEWKKSIEKSLEVNAERGENNYELMNYLEFKREILRLSDSFSSPITKYLILLELVTFSPYCSLDENKSSVKNLEYEDKGATENRIRSIATELAVNTSYVEVFKGAYSKAIKDASGGIISYLFGGALLAGIVVLFFINPIAGAAAAPGLYGAAAVSSGLAVLGGGAIAAGGFGVAGGISVIVGGGALLGSVSGGIVGSLLVSSPDFALSQAAKLEVVFKEVVLLGQKDARLAQEMIKEQRQAIGSLEDKLLDMKRQAEKNSKEIDNLGKSIEYLKKALKRNEEAFENA